MSEESPDQTPQDENEPEATGGDEGVGASDSGLPSQDDIDALLNTASEGGESASEDAETPGESGGGSAEFSQADIDAAFQSPDETSAQTPEPAGSVGFSQADIDAALSAAAGGGSSQPAAVEPEPSASAGAEISGLDSAGRPMDDEAAAMAAAIAEESGGSNATPEPAAPVTPAAPVPEPVALPDFSGESSESGLTDISILRDVNLKVHIELGRTNMFIEDVLRLSEGSVVVLDNLAGDPVDVYVNDRLVARGEVLVLSDNFCVRISEIITGPQNVAVA